jgi:hypothetical protein
MLSLGNALVDVEDGELKLLIGSPPYLSGLCWNAPLSPPEKDTGCGSQEGVRRKSPKKQIESLG